MSEPSGLDQFLNESLQPPTAKPIGQEPEGLDSFLNQENVEREVSRTPSRSKAQALVEGGLRGATLGLSDVVLPKLGVSKENMAARKELYGFESGLGNVLGGGAVLGLTGGAAAPMETALGGGLAATAAGYGAEGALLGASNVVSDKALGDPNLNSEKIAAEIGTGAALGIGFGLVGKGINSILGKSGAPKGSLANKLGESELQSNTEAETANALTKEYGLKENAPEIIQAAKELGAPITEGMVSDNPWVQRFEDSLAHGAPTYSAIRKAKQFEAGYNAVESNIKGIVGESEIDGGLSKAAFGNAMEQSLANNIAEEQKPISDLFESVKPFTQNIELNKNSLPRIAENIMDLDPVRLDPDGPAGQLARRMGKSIENIQTVDDVKALRKILSDSLAPTASRNEKYVIGEIQDRLKDLEENTLVRHGEKLVEAHGEAMASLNPAEAAERDAIWRPHIENIEQAISNRQEAMRQYAPFITKIKTLAKYFGRKNISGAQGAIDFITHDLTPEALANKVTQKGNSEFAAFFEKNFPNETELLKKYEVSKLREAAINERTGDFDSRKFIKSVFKLEPERRELLFAKDELKKLEAARTYLRSIPEDFNPSHTAHEEALRSFFEHPMGAAISNVRDYGIDTFIKNIVKLPPELRPNPLEAGAQLADKFKKLDAAQKLINKTDNQIIKGAKSIFNKNTVRGLTIGAGREIINASYDNKVERISELANDPNVFAQHISNHTQGVERNLPNIAQGVQNHVTNSMMFLNSKVPRPPATFPLSAEWKPSNLQKQKFEQYFQAVNNPLIALDQIRDGNLTNETMEALGATHPSLLQDMRIKVMGEMKVEKAQKLPYAVRISLAQFLGEPLDSSMLHQVTLANQSMFSPNQNQQAEGNQPRQKSTQTGLAKLDLSKRSATEAQDLEESEV